MDLLQESFESLVFFQPRVHLGEKLFGDVDRARFALLFEGEVLASVQRSAVVTAAGGAPAAVGVSAERGGEDGGSGGELVESALEHAQDETGVVGNVHETSRGRVKNRQSVERFSGRRGKNPGATRTTNPRPSHRRERAGRGVQKTSPQRARKM